MAEQSVDGGLELRARLVKIPFERLLHLMCGREQMKGLPETSYIRSAQINMALQCFELMVIDGSFPPSKVGHAIPFIAVEFEPVSRLRFDRKKPYTAKKKAKQKR